MKTVKTYPFSLPKHAHDIEFYHNRVFNTMSDMESGEIPMDTARYNELYDLYYGPLAELMDVIYGSRSPVAQLTGPQIGLAKEIVAWAHETRSASCIERGRYDLLKYC